MKEILKKVFLVITLALSTVFITVGFVWDTNIVEVQAEDIEQLNSYYELDNVYSTYSPSTNYTIGGAMYSDRDGLSIRPKTTTRTDVGVTLPFINDILVTADTALVVDVMFYSNLTRTMKLELVQTDTTIKKMQNDLNAYTAKNNEVVSTLLIGNNAFNNNLNASSGFATKDVSTAYNQLVVPFTSLGYAVGDTASLSEINFYAPGWSTGTYDKYLLMGINLSSDFSTTSSFTSEPVWEAGVDSYTEYGAVSANLDIQLLEAGKILMDPSMNGSGSAVSQELVFKFPDALINESGTVDTANLVGMTLEFLNETATNFNGYFKLYSTTGDAIANSNYSNLKTHKVTKDGTEADSNAKYFYPNTNTVGYADSFIRYNFNATNAVTSESTESFYSSGGELPAQISPYLTFSYDNSTSLSLDGVHFGKIRILTSDISVYENTASSSENVTISSVKGYLGNQVTFTAVSDEKTVETVTLNNVALSNDEVAELFSLDGLTVTMTGDMNLTINYQKYIVTFYDEDGVTELGTSTVDYGADATAPADPIKDATAQYTYSFDGWDKAFTNVTADLSVQATYTEALNQYTVTFYDEDGVTELGTSTVNYGTDATAPADPMKDATAQYTYTFDSWDKAFTNVTADLSVQATYTEVTNQYTVTFYDEDGVTELGTSTVDYGADAIVPADPTKDATAQYTYTFDGWDKAFTNVTADLSVQATYTETLNQYIVTFYDEDGVTELGTSIVDYGTAATAPTDPTKDATAQYTYTFDSWDKAFTNVTADLSVQAIYTEALNKYTVTFYDEDGVTELGTSTVNYGADATAPADPTKDATAQYTYTFDSWDIAFTNVTSDLSVQAKYTEVTNQYTVTFYDEDGVTELGTSIVDYGTAATAPTDPTKTSTTHLTFTFANWDKAFTNVTEDFEVTAVYQVGLLSSTNLIVSGLDTVYQGSEWIDKGILVDDELITFTVIGTVDTSQIGDYRIEYIVSYNQEELVSYYRIVNVIEEPTIVEITLLPDVTTILVDEDYQDAGATTSSGDIVITNNVDVTTAGVYTIEYTVTIGTEEFTKTKYVTVVALVGDANSELAKIIIIDEDKRKGMII